MSHVVAVGNCGYDHSAMSGWLSREFGVKCTAAHDWEDLQAELRGGDVALVIVNRVLDRDGSEGLDVVRRMKTEAEHAEVPVMLLSNFEEAQQAAEALGANRGFGKREFNSPRAVAMLRPYLQRAAVAH